MRYTYKLFNSIGLSISVDIYKDDKYDHSYTRVCSETEAHKVAQEYVNDLNKKGPYGPFLDDSKEPQD